MKLIVGLGNPGAQYERTRHNAGFMAVDRLRDVCAPSEIWKSKFQSLMVEGRLAENADGSGAAEKVVLLKPVTFMNLSGRAVTDAVRFYKLDPEADILVLVDDVALSCGQIRIRAKGGTGGHNGLASIQQMLSTSAYARLRIGIDPPGIIPQVDYVLGRFTDEQMGQIEKAMKTCVDAARTWVHQGAIAAMNAFNAPDEQKKPKPKPEPTASAAEPSSDETKQPGEIHPGWFTNNNAGDAPSSR
ncbi:MAG: aminoacyl-tRNA hydrolase [Phycisphaerales bacterium]